MLFGSLLPVFPNHAGCSLRHHGFRRNTKNLFEKPDISIKKYKVVIFIDSCFGHQCPIHGNMPKTNLEYW
nr:hypothetical protein [Peribacillus sp. Bi134]